LKDYERDIKISDGEAQAKLPSGKLIKPFIKKGAFQVGNDLERMVDYLEIRYAELGIATQRQRFIWREIPQSNLVAVIPGKDKNAPPVVLADHIDSAVAEDIYEKSGQRVTTPGANDNSTATAMLLQAAKILRGAQPKRSIWLVHLTGEEFPAVDLGARHFLSEIMRRKQDIYGVVITDFIGSHQPNLRRFQISPTAVAGSEHFAALALDAAATMFPGDVEASYQPRDKSRNSVFQTDLLEFEFRGFPGILFNEDMDYSHPETNNPNYHQSTDVVANIDLDFSAKVSKIAIETVLRMANE
jgi:Zn-dependent M28 family amino/carboxypeptidase